MRVKILKTGKVEDHGAAYAARLIEQGRAVAVPAAPEKPTRGKAAKAAPITPAPAAEKE